MAQVGLLFKLGLVEDFKELKVGALAPRTVSHHQDQTRIEVGEKVGEDDLFALVCRRIKHLHAFARDNVYVVLNYEHWDLLIARLLGLGALQRRSYFKFSCVAEYADRVVATNQKTSMVQLGKVAEALLAPLTKCKLLNFETCVLLKVNAYRRLLNLFVCGVDFGLTSFWSLSDAP